MNSLLTRFTLGLLCASSAFACSSNDHSNRGEAAVAFAEVKGEQQMALTSGTRQISGVFPHLTTYSQSRKDGKFFKAGHQECGIGAIIPWAGKLWMVTYAPHMPYGSDHKLYSIDDDMNMTIHSESVGGTPAARMIHEESGQLFIAHYAIDKAGKLRVISPKKMPGRITAYARHLEDPKNKVYAVDMENIIYEIDVHTLAFKKLFNNPIPDYHGKGAYTAQGKLVLSNNGATNAKSLDNPKDWQMNVGKRGAEDRGCLATFDGKKWEVIERRQYTEVTGPQGAHPTAEGKDMPLWAIGWDKRSLRLQAMKDGKFTTYLLPKACLNNDAKHGWFTEWPRIRDINETELMMDMHGMFFKFPKDFAPGNSAGITPIASHIRYIPDFCAWNGKLVLATDEASIQGNPLTGQPQSNLWFGDFDDLKEWGPRSAAGSIWMKDAVKGGEASSAFLINGFERRMLHLASDKPGKFLLEVEVDVDGSGNWQTYKTLEVDGYSAHMFSDDLKAQWIRITPAQDCQATASFHFNDDVYRRASEGKELFSALASVDEKEISSALLYPNAHNRDLSVLSNDGKALNFNQVDFSFTQLEKEPAKKKSKISLRQFLTPHVEFTVDEASVILQSKEDRSIVGKKGKGIRLRLPKGNAAYDKPFAEGWPRMHREIESERMMANIHGSFYEVPFWLVGQPALYSKMRPVATHNKKIIDFATWNGLLVLSGLKADAVESEHVYKTKDGKNALWFGGIDDLWKLGKPVGTGGPWKNTAVKANVASDPYLMTGYDKKTLELTADKDCTITLEIDVDHWTGFHKYKTFELKAGEKLTYKFPEAFSAHWVRVKADRDCKATAWFIYE